MAGRSIAVVAPGLAHGTDGGVERVAGWLSEQLSRRTDYEVSLVSLATSSRDTASQLAGVPSQWRPPQQQVVSWNGRQVTHYGAWLGEWEVSRYRARRELTTHLKRFDLIQVVCGTPAWGTCALDAEAPVALQVATTVRAERAHHKDGGAISRYRNVNTRLAGRLERRALRHAAHTFVENEWMRAECERVAPARVSLAPPGVDDDFFVPTPLHQGEPYVLAVGRFGESRKNLPGLIRSYAEARRKGLAQRLVLAGAGVVPRELHDLIRQLDLEACVSFEESVSETRLRELYQGAAVLALASFEEGLGLVLLEAMACGTPVVATATEGAKEVMARGAVGAIVPVFDGVSLPLASALCAWSQRGMTHEDRASARTFATREFGNEVALRRFTDVYDQMLRDQS